MTNETGQTRRIVLGGLAASAGLLSMIDETTAQAQTSGKTFVLVHGAWHGGWCWRRVSDRLEKKGHKVFTPTMTGLGERSHLLDAKINLATHVTDIVNVIKWESLNDIVLVGHSYGGAVVSGVAEQVREATLKGSNVSILPRGPYNIFWRTKTFSFAALMAGTVSRPPFASPDTSSFSIMRAPAIPLDTCTAVEPCRCA